MKTTALFSATSLKFPALPAHQVNQNPKAVERERKEIHRTPKVEAEDEAAGPEAEEARLPKAIKPIHLKVRKEQAKAKARKVKAKVLTQKQKQSQITKVRPSQKETPVDLL